MATIGETLDEFIRQVRDGKSPKLFFSHKIMPEVVNLLKREGFGVSEECLNRIPNQIHRDALKTMLYSTCAFTAAGAVIGAQVAGPQGAAVGATIGAVTGVVAGAFVVYVTISESKGGYTLSPT